MITIQPISTEETYKIRKEILRKDIPLTEKIDGDFDNTTLHLGLFTDDKLVCVATFMQNDSQHFNGLQYRLRGMATLNEYQHRGFGKLILEKAEQLLKKRNVTILWCNARVVALNFYKNCNFEIIGEEFDVNLVGAHFVMYKYL